MAKNEKLQYFSKTKKKWVNFTNDDYEHISMLKKFEYKIRTAPKEDYKKHIAAKRKATTHIKKRTAAAKKREKKEDKKFAKKTRKKSAPSAKQKAARAKFKARIVEAKKIQKSQGISYKAAVKKAFKK